MLTAWILIFIAALIIELSTAALLTIWFVFGAVAALIATALGASSQAQVIIFVLTTAITLFLTRPFLKKLMSKEYTPTNSELDIGASAIVIQEINSSKQTGRIRLNGVDWPAVSADGDIIAEGQLVVIKKRESNVMYVSTLTVDDDPTEQTYFEE